MEKKNIDWGNLGFGYVKTDYRYVSNYKDGKWDEVQAEYLKHADGLDNPVHHTNKC